MPSNGRWRRFKIVEITAPIPTNVPVSPVAPVPNLVTAPATVSVLVPSRADEIIGGLRNALDRGEPMDKVKQSFINAGYKLEEVESAIQKVPQISSRLSKPLPKTAPVKKKLFRKSKKVAPVAVAPVNSSSGVSASDAVPAPNLANAPVAKSVAPRQGKQASPGLVITLIIMGILVLGGVAYLGLNWDKFF